MLSETVIQVTYAKIGLIMQSPGVVSYDNELPSDETCDASRTLCLGRAIIFLLRVGHIKKYNEERDVLCGPISGYQTRYWVAAQTNDTLVSG